MAKSKSVLLVLGILLIGTAVGALAGYRAYLTAGMDDPQGPVNATVLIEWPDGTPAFEENLTVGGRNTTALGFTQKAAEFGNFTIGTREGALGTYIHRIGNHTAEGNCGWLYQVGHEDNDPQDGDRAADLTRVFEGGLVRWYWGCIQR